MAVALQFSSGAATVRVHAQEAEVKRPGSPKRPAILLLHGFGGHNVFWMARLAPLLTEAGIGLYAPHYFDRTQTTHANLSMLTDGVHVPQWLTTIDEALHFVSSRPATHRSCRHFPGRVPGVGTGGATLR